MRFIGLFLLLLLLEGCALRTGQSTTQPFRSQTISVTGYALDAATREPMAGVPVAKNDGQTITAKDGFFRLKYHAAKKEQYLYDESGVLRVSSLNYAGSAAIPDDTTQRVKLLLLCNAYRFPPHGSLHPADSVQVSTCFSPWIGLPGSQRAYLIQDSSIHQPRKLRALTFRIGKDGFVREPFRVRIYQFNGTEQPPGKDLLTENYLILPGTEGVFSYDLSSYDVIMPDSGFFLALEYSVGGDKFYPSWAIVGYAPIGPVLCPPYSFADTRTWEYTIGQGWRRMMPAENCWPLYESALSVEVEPVPTPPTKR